MNDTEIRATAGVIVGFTLFGIALGSVIGTAAGSRETGVWIGLVLGLLIGIAFNQFRRRR